jgi:hypothetical protein
MTATKISEGMIALPQKDGAVESVTTRGQALVVQENQPQTLGGHTT